jgi:hypothetical protein
MYAYEANLARAIVSERINEASQRGLARELRRRDQPATAAAPARTLRRPSGLWRRAHLRHAYA